MDVLDKENDLYPAEFFSRFVAETHSGQRSDFQRDKARIVHSSALRRLGAKTQVLGANSNDFVRTRLTHSLEVAQVGREIAGALGADPDVVDAACLAHDLGHPPFGHSGERVLDKYAKDIGGFEGNAQTLRLLVRLEPKAMSASGQMAGLNLTRATLDAVAKYPFTRGQVEGTEKFGVYLDDLEVFNWMRQLDQRPKPQRFTPCLDAQIMDYADDIAYSVHDVEDAIRTFAFNPEVLRSQATRAAVYESTCQWYRGIEVQALEEAFENLVKQKYWINDFAGSYADLAALKELTSQLIGRFVSSAKDATTQKLAGSPLSRYNTTLVVPPATRAEIALLKGLAVHFVMAPRETTHSHIAGLQMLADLVEALMESGSKHLAQPYLTQYQMAADSPLGTDGARLRAIIDQVASLTDVSCGRWHAQLCGMISAPV